jgi:calpain-7
MSSSPIQFIEDAIEAARRAVQFDSEGQLEPAIYFYKVASKLLINAAGVSEPDKAESLRHKSLEYSNRSVTLENIKNKQYNPIAEDVHKQRLRRCHFLFQQALDADSEGLKDTAVELYTQAIEYVTHYPELMQGDLKDVALQALDRAEELKGIIIMSS